MRERGPPACSGRAQSGYGGVKPPLRRTRCAGLILSRAVGESVHKDSSEDRGLPVSFLSSGGVALEGTFEEISVDDFRWLMNINFWGVVYGVKYFLPMLKREERAHIVNISSVFGLIAPPGQPAYSASKFAVRGFTECLRHELAGTPVRVSCVHPGGINAASSAASRAS